MSKKNKPALFELINKSTLKPPAWAYPGKQEPAGDASRSEDPKSPSPKRPFIPPHVATPAKPARSIKKPRDFKPFSGRIAILTGWLANLRGHLSYLTLAIIAVGIAVSLAILSLFNWNTPPASEIPAIKGGDSSANTPAPPANPNNPVLPEEIADLQNQPPRNDIWPEARFSTDINSAGPQKAEPDGTATPLTLSGQCWVICGHKDRDPLLFVQKYFNDNGLETITGKFDGRFVLVTRLTFTSSRSDEAKNLKNLLENIGKYYNNNRPEGAPSYSLATFQSAYAVNIDRIDLNL